MCVCVGGGGDKLHDYDSRPKSVCLCKTEDFSQLRKKKRKKKNIQKKEEQKNLIMCCIKSLWPLQQQLLIKFS